jgi:error-prone DNA polymerase
MYTELHCHSAFSFLDGASLPEQLALQAQALGYSALALTDHNGVYGSMVFAQAAKHLEIQPITGAEVTLLDGTHLTLLAETQTGYANLCRLITEAHLESEDRRDPRLDITSLEQRHEGLIVLSGCRNGLVPTVLEHEGVASARRLLERYRSLFGRDRFFVELQRNQVRGDRALTHALSDLADSLGLHVVATGNAHYHRPERYRLHDAMVAIQHRVTLDTSHDVRPSSTSARPRKWRKRFAIVPTPLPTRTQLPSGAPLSISPRT